MSEVEEILRAARAEDTLRAENVRLRRALLEAVMTMNRSDPFFTVFMERYGDLVPIRAAEERGDAA